MMRVAPNSLKKIGVNKIKVASTDITNVPFLNSF